MKKSLFVLILLSSISFAQKTSLDIAGMTVKLGMTKEAFLKILPTVGCTSDSVSENALNINRDRIIYGTIILSKNKISTIRKYLTNSSMKDAFEIISTYYDALIKEMGSEKFNETHTYLSEKIFPNYKVKNITILKGNWQITLSIDKLENVTSVSINEVIGI